MRALRDLLPVARSRTTAYLSADAGRVARLRRWLGHHPAAVTITGSLVVGGALVVGLWGNRADFAVALGLAPVWILAAAILLHVVWLVARSEAWHVCIGAAGGSVSRRRLYRAASLGYLGNTFNGQFGLAVRIAALRRSAPVDSPAPSVLVAAELPIVVVEVSLAALTSFTLVGPLDVPWWVPLLCFAFGLAVIGGLTRVARDRREGFWKGFAVMRNLQGRSSIIGLVVFAVCAQIARNWLVLQGIGVDASVLDATALLIGVAVIGLLPVGPSLGAAAAVVILGANGVAATAAAGALLTATGALGAVCFASWALADRLRPSSAAPLPAIAPVLRTTAAVPPLHGAQRPARRGAAVLPSRP
jgi:uncharacterized membrane protein YbhN (UPF0104 family)